MGTGLVACEHALSLCRLKPKKQRSKKIIITPDLSLPVLTPEFVFERQSYSNKWYSGRNSRIEDLWLEQKRIPKPNVVNTGAKNKVEKGEK